MTLRDLPPVRALAEERARRLYDAIYIPGATSPWDFVPGQMREHLTDGQLAILCNLRDNPDSRDAVARLVERFGDASDADKARHHRDNPGELEALALAVLA